MQNFCEVFKLLLYNSSSRRERENKINCCYSSLKNSQSRNPNGKHDVDGLVLKFLWNLAAGILTTERVNE